MGLLSVLLVFVCCLSVVFEREQKGKPYLSDLRFGERGQCLEFGYFPAGGDGMGWGLGV